MNAENHKPRPQIFFPKGNRGNACCLECIYRFQELIVGFRYFHVILLEQFRIHIQRGYCHTVRISVHLAVKGEIVQCSPKNPGAYFIGDIIIHGKNQPCFHIRRHGSCPPVEEHIRQFVSCHSCFQLHFIRFRFRSFMHHVHIRHIRLNGFQCVIKSNIIPIGGIGVREL